MIYAIVIGLTLVASWSIIKVIAKRKKEKFNRVIYRQSDLHKIMKKFFSYQSEEVKKPPTQLEKFRDKDKINILVMGEEAYWVSDNMFFIAKAEDGRVLLETAEPVDINNMSKKDINRMLFILDNLKERDVNDSGGTGNERF
jgi:metal-dependent hydrolase (beta-lactamase superfamily II)